MLRSTDPVVPLLRNLGLSNADATRLAHMGTLVELAAGTRMVTEGKRGLEAFLLIEGEAVVDRDGKEFRVGPGDVVGETATLDPFARRNATVTTATDVLALVYDVRTFRSLAATDLRDVLVPDRAA
jgi:CRP-like cAMP-binding protein